MVTELIRGKWWSFGWGRSVVIESTTDTGVDVALTVLTPTGQLRRITSVDVHYTVPVSLDITLTFRSGLGAIFDTVQEVKTLVVAQDWHWVPLGDRYLTDLDAFEVFTPSPGPGGIASVTMKSEVF